MQSIHFILALVLGGFLAGRVHGEAFPLLRLGAVGAWPLFGEGSLPDRR